MKLTTSVAYTRWQENSYPTQQAYFSAQFGIYLLIRTGVRNNRAAVLGNIAAPARSTRWPPLNAHPLTGRVVTGFLGSSQKFGCKKYSTGATHIIVAVGRRALLHANFHTVTIDTPDTNDPRVELISWGSGDERGK